MSVSHPLLDDDAITPFQIGDTAVRGRMVKLGSAIDEILARHPFDDQVNSVLGEMAALVAMMGSALKFDGRLILQLQGEGPVSLMVADFQADGGLRATASLGGALPDDAGLAALFGKGHIVMTVDQGPQMERYQGVTPLEGDRLEAAAVGYFMQSEQIPSAIRLAVGRLSLPGAPVQWRAGGVMVQLVPGEGGERERGEEVLHADADQEIWRRAEAFLQTTQADELLDPTLDSQTLLYRLFHEDGVRVFDKVGVRATCGCGPEKISSVLSRYDEAELAQMAEGDAIKVSCEFCRTDYYFSKTGEHLAQ